MSFRYCPSVLMSPWFRAAKITSGLKPPKMICAATGLYTGVRCFLSGAPRPPSIPGSSPLMASPVTLADRGRGRAVTASPRPGRRCRAGRPGERSYDASGRPALRAFLSIPLPRAATACRSSRKRRAPRPGLFYIRHTTFPVFPLFTSRTKKQYYAGKQDEKKP